MSKKKRRTCSTVDVSGDLRDLLLDRKIQWIQELESILGGSGSGINNSLSELGSSLSSQSPVVANTSSYKTKSILAAVVLIMPMLASSYP